MNRKKLIFGKPGLILIPFMFLSVGFFSVTAFSEEMKLDTFTTHNDPGDTVDDWDSSKFSPVFGSGDNMFFQFFHKNGAHYLHLASGDDNSFSIGSEKKFKVKDWPVLSWDWKVTKTPKGGDVRVEEKDDQAGSMCLVVDPGLTSSWTLCYIFENDGPKNVVVHSTKRDESKYFILRTKKADKLGTWYSEKRNILADYMKAFGKPPHAEAIIGVMIDSDSTESSAEAFYRNIVLKKK